MSRYPHEVSGGQRQRVLIAGAMVLYTATVARRRTGGLARRIDPRRDPRVDALARRRHGISIVAVTHDLGLAWNIADRIAVMYLGRIVEVGTAEEVLADPQHPYTKALLSVVPEADGWNSRSWSARHPTPQRSRLDAGSIRAARWWRLERPNASASSIGAPATTRRSPTPPPIGRWRVTSCGRPVGSAATLTVTPGV